MTATSHDSTEGWTPRVTGRARVRTAIARHEAQSPRPCLLRPAAPCRGGVADPAPRDSRDCSGCMSPPLLASRSCRGRHSRKPCRGVGGGLAGVGALLPIGTGAETILASVGLVTAAAVLVHLSGGTIEAHFHSHHGRRRGSLPGLVACRVAIAFVTLHHGIAGALAPIEVYNHPAAIEHPWRWAAIHGLAILGMSAAAFVNGGSTNRSTGDQGPRSQARRSQELATWAAGNANGRQAGAAGPTSSTGSLASRLSRSLRRSRTSSAAFTLRTWMSSANQSHKRGIPAALPSNSGSCCPMGRRAGCRAVER